MSGTIFGHAWVNVFYVNLTHTSAVTINDLATLSGDINTPWSTNIQALLSTDCVLTQIDIRYIPSVGNELRYTQALSETGGGGGAVNDASACVPLTWVISDYYRGGHPRISVAGIPGSDVTNGSNISPTFLSSLVTAFNAWRNAVNAITTTNITGCVMGTVLFEHLGAWRTPPVFTPFTSIKVGKNGKLGSQRRRILA